MQQDNIPSEEPHRLTKAERKRFRREQKLQEKQKETHSATLKRFIAWGAALVIVIAVIAGLARLQNGPSVSDLPVESPTDLGREHVSVGEEPQEYSSNPPTSGPHYASWTKAGFYDKPIADGLLIHSLEHGYVIMNYNCDKAITFKEPAAFFIQPAFAQIQDETFGPRRASVSPSANPNFTIEIPEDGIVVETETETTPQPMSAAEEPTAENEVTLSENFEAAECGRLKDELQNIVEDFDTKKVIAVPRPANDHLISVTAWGRVMHQDNYDADAIKAFVKQFRDKGPEKTVE